MHFTTREIIIIIVATSSGIFVGLGLKFAIELLFKLFKKLLGLGD